MITKMARRTTMRAALAMAGLMATSGQTKAQDNWPNRPVRLIVPFSPGGSNDLLARPLAEQLGKTFGHSFVVENRAGAGGAIGADVVAKSAPDGHTLLFISSSLATNAATQQLPYDPRTDFTPIAEVAVAPMVVVVGKDSPARDMGALLHLIRDKPGELRFGGAGPGDTNFFAAELLKMAANLRMEAVAYRGMSEALLDVAAGRIDLIVTTMASARSLIEAGQLRLLAVAADQRDPRMPNVPTVREFGVDYATGVWWGVFGPARLPAALVGRLNVEINRALAEESYQRLLEAGGAQAAPGTPSAFAKKFDGEVTRWTDVARRAGVAIR